MQRKRGEALERRRRKEEQWGRLRNQVALQRNEARENEKEIENEKRRSELAGKVKEAERTARHLNLCRSPS